MIINASMRLMIADVNEVDGGVTFDAFKGWARQKQKQYLDDHPNSTFFDKIGITNRADREHKKTQSKIGTKVKQLERELRRHRKVPDIANELKERINKLKQHSEKVRDRHEGNKPLTFGERKTRMAKIKRDMAKLYKEYKRVRGAIKKTKDRRLINRLRERYWMLEGEIQKRWQWYQMLQR